MACVTGAGAGTGAATTGDDATLTGPAPAPDDVVTANELLAAAAALVSGKHRGELREYAGIDGALTRRGRRRGGDLGAR